jgi:hypothetical protein
MTVWGGMGRREVAKPPEAGVSAVKRPAAQQEQYALGIYRRWAVGMMGGGATGGTGVR